MEYCDCGRQASSRCKSCGRQLCRFHTPPHGDDVLCESCQTAQRTAQEVALRNAVEQQVMSSHGISQVAAALSVDYRVFHNPFNHFRSLGVKFRTGSPWDEVKLLFREHPINTGPGVQYFLKIGTTTTFGTKQHSYDLDAIPAVWMQIHSSEGYTVAEGLLAADGKVMRTVPASSRRQISISTSPSAGAYNEGVGPNPWQTFRTVRSYRREIELRRQGHPSVCLGDAEAHSFMGQMLSIWKSSHSS